MNVFQNQNRSNKKIFGTVVEMTTILHIFVFIWTLLKIISLYLVVYSVVSIAFGF